MRPGDYTRELRERIARAAGFGWVFPLPDSVKVEVVSAGLVDVFGDPLMPQLLGTFSNQAVAESPISFEAMRETLASIPAPEPGRWDHIVPIRDIVTRPKTERERGSGWVNLSAVERNARAIDRWRVESLSWAFVMDGALHVPRAGIPVLEEELRKAGVL